MKAAKAQKEARERAETGDWDGAKRLLTEAAEELRKVAPGSPRADELLAQAEETTGFAAEMSEARYDAKMKKSLKYSSWQRQRGRPRN